MWLAVRHISLPVTRKSPETTAVMFLCSLVLGVTSSWRHACVVHVHPRARPCLDMTDRDSTRSLRPGTCTPLVLRGVYVLALNQQPSVGSHVAKCDREEKTVPCRSLRHATHTLAQITPKRHAAASALLRIAHTVSHTRCLIAAVGGISTTMCDGCNDG